MAKRTTQPNEPFASIRHIKKRAFLSAFAKTGVILHAAAAAGCDRHMHSIWMRRDAAYREAFAVAQEEAIERMELEARRRAVNGVDEPVFQGGKQVTGADGTPAVVRKYSDTLLIFLLKAARPAVYRENIRHEVGGVEGGAIRVESLQAQAVALVSDPESAALMDRLAKRIAFPTHGEGPASPTDGD